MAMPSRFQLMYGRDAAPTVTRELHAGRTTALLDGRDLRYLRFGGLELVRRVYVAVRDLNWNTIPGEVSDVTVEDRGDGFAVRFSVSHHHRDIDFGWHGTIDGAPDGAITYSMDGMAEAPFRYAKIGICIHHPTRECAGRPFAGQTPDGPVGGALPQAIGPQIHLEDGTDLPLFPPVQSLTIDLGHGVEVRFTFDGDLFEMEDQRNWTDASFKTASTPASLGYVHEAHAGMRVRQSVTIQAAGAMHAQRLPERNLRVTVGGAIGRTIPPIGLGMASHGGDLSAREIVTLRRMAPDHLRADLRLAEPGHERELARALSASAKLGCGLELALFLGDGVDSQLGDLATRLAESAVPVRRVLVFHEDAEATTGRWVRLARERLGSALPGVPFCGGTNVYFNELNRNRPDVAAMDGVAYSINPQIHAFDEASLVEALAAQAETVISARAFCGDLPLVISPVTLKPRFNAVATVPEGGRQRDELPDQVDPRQMSLFGAAWTLGSVKYLAEGGAASITYYDTTGWRGVMETEVGSPVPTKFPTRPGDVFPLYHVLRDAREWASGALLAARSSDPLRAEALAVRTAEGVHLTVANMTPDEQRVAVGPIAAQRVTIRYLDTESAPTAMRDPETFRSSAGSMPIVDGELTLDLPPFALARVDVELST